MSAPSAGIAIRAQEETRAAIEKPPPEINTISRNPEETKKSTIVKTDPLSETGVRQEKSSVRRKTSAVKTAGEKIYKKETPSPAPEESSNVTDKIKEATRAKEETPEKHPLPPSRAERNDTSRIDAYLYSARTYEIHNDYSNALANYKKALDIDKNNITILNNIAYIYLQLGIMEDSVKYAQMALNLNGDYVPALINMGIAQAGSGNDREAEDSLKRAVALDPDNQAAFFNLALLHEQRENYNEAFHYYLQLAKLGNAGGALGQARIYEKQNKTEEALQQYKNVYALDSADADTKIRARQRIQALLKTKR